VTELPVAAVATGWVADLLPSPSTADSPFADALAVFCHSALTDLGSVCLRC
jgi:hypothetical protein